MIRTLPILASMLMITFSHVHAQMLESKPVDFVIKKIHYQTNFNDTMLVRLLFDFEVDDDGVILIGTGALNMCGCYCDSLWDAWPAGGVAEIPGTGTFHYLSGDNGEPPPTGVPRNGVLGIQALAGGTERDTEFNLSTRFIVED